MLEKHLAPYAVLQGKGAEEGGGAKKYLTTMVGRMSRAGVHVAWKGVTRMHHPRFGRSHR